MSQPQTHLQISLLSSTKQLRNLHNEIMDLASHYKQTSSQYLTKIKYRMKESINTANCMGEGKQEFQRKVQLQNAFSRDDLKHQSLDVNFKNLFVQEYVQKNLKNKVIFNDVFVRKQLQDAKIDAFPCSGIRVNQENLKEINDFQAKELKILNTETHQIHLNTILLELQKQKHFNSTLQTEIQLLQNEYDSLETYCKAQEKGTDKKISTQKPISLYEEDDQFQIDQREGEQEQKTDEELSNQLQCLERLIKSKSKLISQLEESNHWLRLKTNQLKSRQVYLNKKRMLLESGQRPKLQKQLNQLLESLKSQMAKKLEQHSDQNSHSIQVNDAKVTTQKLLDKVKQLSGISHLIESSLREQVLKQKLYSISNQLNS